VAPSKAGSTSTRVLPPIETAKVLFFGRPFCLRRTIFGPQFLAYGVRPVQRPVVPPISEPATLFPCPP
jgi:hypothetical protein